MGLVGLEGQVLVAGAVGMGRTGSGTTDHHPTPLDEEGPMTTTPSDAVPENDPEVQTGDESEIEGNAGVEVGMTDGESTFEPEEDPEGHS